MSCKISYEVTAEVRSLKTKRSIVFDKKTAARAFQRKWPGSELRPVEVCDNGVVRRRGKRSY